jgi:hypothetical protein
MIKPEIVLGAPETFLDGPTQARGTSHMDVRGDTTRSSEAGKIHQELTP